MKTPFSFILIALFSGSTLHAKSEMPAICASLTAPGDPGLNAATLSYLRALTAAARDRLVGESELIYVRDANQPDTPWGAGAPLEPEKQGYQTVLMGLCRRADLDWPSVRKGAAELLADRSAEKARQRDVQAETARFVGLHEVGSLKLPQVWLSPSTSYQTVFYRQGRPYGLYLNHGGRGIYLVDLRERKFIRKTPFAETIKDVYAFEHGGQTYGVTYTQEPVGTSATVKTATGLPATLYRYQVVVFDPFSGKRVSSVETAQSTKFFSGISVTQWNGKAYAIAGGMKSLKCVELSPTEPILSDIQARPPVESDDGFWREGFGKFIHHSDGKLYFVHLTGPKGRTSGAVRIFDVEARREVNSIPVTRMSASFAAFSFGERLTALVFSERGGRRNLEQRAQWLDLLSGKVLSERAFRHSTEGLDQDPAVVVEPNRRVQFVVDSGTDYLFGEIDASTGKMDLAFRPERSESPTVAAYVPVEIEDRRFVLQGMANGGLRFLDISSRSVLAGRGEFQDPGRKGDLFPMVFWDRGQPFATVGGPRGQIRFFSLRSTP